VHRLFKFPAVWLIVSILFLSGLLLINFSSWIEPYIQGQQKLNQENYTESLKYFDQASERFASSDIAKKILPDIYTAIWGNQFHILYQLGDYDTLFEKVSTSPISASIHHWTGCAFFRRAGEHSDDAREQIVWLERASGEFLSVLKLEPENWNAKYNFELTNRLIDGLKNEEEAPPQILEILLPRPRQGEQPSRLTG